MNAGHGTRRKVDKMWTSEDDVGGHDELADIRPVWSAEDEAELARLEMEYGTRLLRGGPLDGVTIDAAATGWTGRYKWTGADGQEHEYYLAEEGHMEWIPGHYPAVCAWDEEAAPGDVPK